MNAQIAPSALSPVHDALRAHGGKPVQAGKLLSIADHSLLPRASVKGPGAAAWLEALGLSLPSQPNHWLSLPQGGLVARLGQSEYLIEGDTELVAKIAATPRTPGVYPVLRQDASFSLSGSAVNELFLQTCNVDFRILDADPSLLLMTSMVGVSVVVVPFAPLKAGADAQFRLWCDGTYGLHLWETLSEIIAEIAEPGTGAALSRPK